MEKLSFKERIETKINEIEPDQNCLDQLQKI